MFDPKKPGFFALIYQQVDEGLTAEERARFNACQSLEARVKNLAGVGKVNLLLDQVVEPFRGKKSAVRSTENREAGNAQFLIKNIAQAQILYSIAVYSAPCGDNSPELSLALANRSACLQIGKFYEGALEDILLSFEAGYPESKRFKLHERAAECHVSLAQTRPGNKQWHTHKAISSYKEAIATAPKSNLNKEKVAKFVKDMKNKILVIQSGLDNEEVPPIKSPPVSTDGRIAPLLETMEPNKNYSCLHKNISIRYEPGRGRFGVANADIPVGTPLVIERPTLSFTLHPDKFGFNCQHCFKVVKRVVPCPRCIWVCFCSKDCRDKALGSYHKYECAFMKHLLESGLNVYPFLATRAIANLGLAKLLELRPELDARDESKGVTSGLSQSYSSDDFVNVYCLMAHEDSVDDDTWLLRSLVALYLLKCFKHSTDFFGQPQPVTDNKDLTPEECFVGAVLLRLLNICPTNCHDISEMETPVMDSFSKMCNKVSLGAAIYPTLALFNHGCDPSFMRCNNGNSVICVASKAISAGDEIFENYGLMFTVKTLGERQKILQNHYGFKCECVACVENWPDTISMLARRQANINNPLSSLVKVKCSKCGGILKQWNGYNARNEATLLTCLICGYESNLTIDIPLRDIKNESDHAKTHLHRGDWEIGLKHVTKCEQLVNKHVSMPNLELSESRIAIWRCLWLKFGSMKLVKLI